MPGNGASTSDAEDDCGKDVVAMTTPLNQLSGAEKLALPQPAPVHQKTPKLSRFFSSTKKRSKSPTPPTLMHSSSTMSGRPTVAKASVEASPKSEKGASSKGRDAKHASASPSKTTPKSPPPRGVTVEIQASLTSVPASPKSRLSKSTKSDKDKAKVCAITSHKSPKKNSKADWVKWNSFLFNFSSLIECL